MSQPNLVLAARRQPALSHRRSAAVDRACQRTAPRRSERIRVWRHEFPCRFGGIHWRVSRMVASRRHPALASRAVAVERCRSRRPDRLLERGTESAGWRGRYRAAGSGSQPGEALAYGRRDHCHRRQRRGRSRAPNSAARLPGCAAKTRDCPRACITEPVCGPKASWRCYSRARVRNIRAWLRELALHFPELRRYFVRGRRRC